MKQLIVSMLVLVVVRWIQTINAEHSLLTLDRKTLKIVQKSHPVLNWIFLLSILFFMGSTIHYIVESI